MTQQLYRLSAVPASSGTKVMRNLVREVQRVIGAQVSADDALFNCGDGSSYSKGGRGGAGRLVFEASPSLDRFTKLPSAANIRYVAFHGVIPEDVDISADALGAWLVDSINWSKCIGVWHQFGNSSRSNSIYLHIRSRRSGKEFPSDVSQQIPTALAVLLEQMAVSSDGHDYVINPVVKRQRGEMEIQLVTHGRSILAEIMLLARPAGGVQGLMRPGMKPVESWALVKTLDIKPNDIVVDPMCGCGSFLMEGWRSWPEASYVGVDIDPKQLSYFQENIEQFTGSSNKVKYFESDSSRHGGIPLEDRSVDKIVTCPPFGRQFGSIEGNKELYPSLMKECKRIVKEGGRMVFLVDIPNKNTLLSTIQNVLDVHWRVSAMREFPLTDETTGVLVVVDNTLATSTEKVPRIPDSTSPLWWESLAQAGSNGNRTSWANLRLECLPSLVPFSSHREQD